jgi:hypothetical protein
MLRIIVVHFLIAVNWPFVIITCHKYHIRILSRKLQSFFKPCALVPQIMVEERT